MDKFKTKKKYGQNFINDINIIYKIVNSTDIDKETIVIEVGPGKGILTKVLGEKAKVVIAYEIDKTLEPILTKELQGRENIEIIYDDFLRRRLEDDLRNFQNKKIYLIANLPYYITTPIINKVIDSQVDIEKIVIMVQKEVGDRFLAKINTKAYNSLTVFLNYYYDIRKIFDVSRKVFTPVPNVDSVVVELDRKKELLKIENEEFFFKLVRDSFKYKRKTIKNNLREYNLAEIEKVLKDNNLDLNSRAENISLDVFVKIANKLSLLL